MNNNNNFGALALAGALTLGGTSALAEDCKPGTPGYLPGIFSSTCVATVTSPSEEFKTRASFSRARVAGTQDTGKLDIMSLTPAVQSVHTTALTRLDTIVGDIGGAPIQNNPPIVNISGVVTASSSPDTNIDKVTLKRTTGTGSPAVALFMETDENIATAKNRCAELLAKLPKEIENNGTTVKITTEGLTCKPTVKTLDIDTWSAPLMHVGKELTDKKIIHPDLDDAMIKTIILANTTPEVLKTLSPESQSTIEKLNKELVRMREIDIDGSMTVSMMINKTEYNWTNIGLATGSGILALIVALSLMYARGKNTGRKDLYA